MLLRVRGRGSVFRVIPHKIAGWNVLRGRAPYKIRAVAARRMSEVCPWKELGQFGRLLAGVTWAEMEFRCRNDVDLEPREPKFSNQSCLSQIVAILASGIWRGRLESVVRKQYDNVSLNRLNRLGRLPRFFAS